MRSPGSWQGGSWVSALLDDVFCLTPSLDLALWSCVSPYFMSEIILFTGTLDAVVVWSCRVSPSSVFCLCLLCLGLVLLCLVPVSSCGLTRLRTDCSMLHFRTPKRDTVYALV